MSWDWNAVIGVGTVALAIFTAAMAWQTRALALETRDLIKQDRSDALAEQQRHVETFQPHLAISRLSIKSALPVNLFELRATNIGPGYAREIRLTLGARAVPPPGVELPPPALRSGGDFKLYDYDPTKATKPVGFTLDYQDAFGRPFKTIVDDPYDPARGYRWIQPPPIS